MNLDVTKIIFLGARGALFSFRGDSLSDPADSSPGDARTWKDASPVVSYSCRLFVVSKKVKSFAIKQIQTLSPKHPGWGTLQPPDLPTFRPSDVQTSDIEAYRMSLLLVPSYFADLNRFCIPSPIVPVPPSRLHFNFASGGSALNGSERRTTQRFQMRLPFTVVWTTGAAAGETSTGSRDVRCRP